MTAQEILELLSREGPLTGSELMDRTRQEALPLWRACRGSDEIHYELVGRRYLRLDRAVNGWARLSPSIRREFRTYTVLGGPGQEVAVSERAKELTADADRISRVKSHLARETMASILAELGIRGVLVEQVTFIIAGDVTYGMAHAVPRPESSTDQLVRGSDLDVIVVVTDDFPVEALRDLDRAIYRRKYYLLVNPSYREEIDYVVKRVAKVREQLRFDTFEHGVASKILHEGKLLCGSRDVFDTVKELVEESWVPGKIAELERQAADNRVVAEQHLLDSSADNRTGEHFNLFYTREEGEEIH